MCFGILYIFKDIVLARPRGVRIDDVNWRQPPCPISSFECHIASNTDCRSLWDHLQSNKLPKEANLWPDVTFLKQLFSDGTIGAHYWNATGDMCADALTKTGLDLSALIELMHGNWRIAEEWIQAKVP